MTFWDTKLFKDKEGEAVPFGAEARWELMRQIKYSETDDVDSTLIFSHILIGLIGFFFLMLILSCGPLLPVWMFINSLQLIVHVPLIASN